MDVSPELFKRRIGSALLRGAAAESDRPPNEIPLGPLLSVLDDEQFIRELYWTILGRSVEPQGLQHNLELLRAGASRRFLIEAFATSPEARSQSIRFSPLPPEDSRIDNPHAIQRELLVILGAGGHARVVLEILEGMRETFEIAGCTGQSPAEPSVLGCPFLGSDDILAGLFASGTRNAFVAIGDNATRKAASLAAINLGYRLVNAVSRHAIVSPRAKLGAGVAIMPGAVVNTQAIIQDGSIVNTGATVDHDCTIGSYAHIGPGANLAGWVQVGEGAFLGVGAKVIDKITIGRWSIVGAGSVVIQDVPDNATVAGVPARVIR